MLINVDFWFLKSYNCLVFSAIHHGNNFNFKLNTEQSFENENTCDIFMNEARIEHELLLKFEKNGSLQLEGSRNPKTNEEKVKENLKKLHAQELF